MKKIITLGVILFTTLTMYCQTPELMSYQAVVRDADSELLTDQAVGMKISILEDTESGTPVYVETQNPSTNSNGLLSLQVGGGTVVSGDITTIDWANHDYFIKTETDPTGGQNYTIAGTSQILSVPYALLSKNVINDLVDDADNDPSNEYNTGFTFNGTDLEITDGGSVQTVDLSVLDNTNLQAELDTTQTGAGLATDGTYNANTTANYIAGATALNDADDKLDAQAKVNADAISANNTQISANTTAISTNATDIATNVTAIALNTAKDTNVSTDLTITGTTGARVIVSSDGTDATIPVATSVVSGVMSKATYDEHLVNTAKTGITTDQATAISTNTSNIATNVTDILTNASGITTNATDIATNVTDIALKANIVSPALTGTPLAPTATAGDSSTAIATTAFVTTAVSTATSGSFVDLTTDQTIAGSKTFSDNTSVGGTLDVTGDTSVSTFDSSGATSLATGGGVVNVASSGVMTTVEGTLNVDEAVTLDTTLGVTGVATLSAQPILSTLTASLPVFSDGSKGLVSNAITGSGSVVMSASPTLTGTPTLPTGTIATTQTAGNSTTAIATTAFVTTAVSASAGATNINGLSDALVESSSIYLGKDPSGTTDNANYNVSVGISALNFITTGDNNVAIGFQSLYANTGGYSNTAIGDNVMRFNIDGFRNTAIGTHSLYRNTAGQYNVSNGGYSLHNNTTGSNSSAFGYKALYNSTGSNNTGLGYQAGDVITTGTNNVIIGRDADPSANTATNQIVIGYNATGAGDNTVQLGNTSITNVKTSGTLTAGAITIPNTDGTNGQVLTTDGSGALSWTTSSAGVSGTGTANMIAKFDGSSTVLGNSSVYDDGTNVGIGAVSPAQLLHVKAASGDAKVLINANGEGDEAHLMLRTGGINKTAIVASGINNWGRTDLRFILNSYTNANDYGLSDTKMIIKNDGKIGIGTESPDEKLDVAGNIKFSGALMPNNNSGSSGQVLTSSGTGVPTWTTISGGATTLVELTDVITTGQSSILIGGGSSSANYNTAFGYSSLDATSSEKNAAFGHNSLTNSTSGGSNSGFGQDSGKNIVSGSFNTVIGRKSGLDISSGEYNVSLGFNAGDNISTNSNNTFIGSNTVGGNTTNASVLGYGVTSQGSNTVTLGNTDITDIYMAQDSGATIHAADLNLGGTAVTATATEINFIDGVTSNVQTQIDALSSSSSVTTYTVNTFYAELGGFVIEIRDGGKHGLVVAMQDQDVSTWYPIDNLLNDAGKHDADGATFMDWRLPTIRELELIYLAKANISPMWGGNDYWSSTRPDSANAYFVNMANGFGTSLNSPGANHTTSNTKAVRAVRTF